MPYRAKRLIAATAFGMSGLATLLLRARSSFRAELRILSYHRIIETSRAYDPGNVSAAPDEFEKQVRYFSKEFDVLGFADLCDICDGRLRAPRRPLIITFDDGFADNYEIAYPILRASGLRAVFFVATKYIGMRELFWFDHVGYCLRYTAADRIELSTGECFDLTSSNHSGILRNILKILKSLPNGERQKEVALIAEQSGDLQGHEVDKINYPMDWGQLKEMCENGMEIMSHTHSHPVLSKLDSFTEKEQELAMSKRLIEEHTGRTCSVIAYPVGRWRSFDEEVLRAVESTGYRFACTNESGLNTMSFPRPKELLRISIDLQYDLAGVRAVLACPEIFAYS